MSQFKFEGPYRMWNIRGMDIGVQTIEGGRGSRLDTSLVECNER